MAGHTLVHIIATFILLICVKLFGYILGFSFLILILSLELGVVFLQAYVFTVLTCIYLNDAINLHHE